MSYLIYNIIRTKLLHIEDVYKYTYSCQAIFDKVVGLLTNIFHYTCKNMKI